MYAVIFTATIHALDSQYSEMAARMRELAITQYGCKEFIASSENGLEIAISYWDDLAQITAWKENAEHLVAQQLGKEKWYQNYRVQVVNIIREYASE